MTVNYGYYKIRLVAHWSGMRRYFHTEQLEIQCITGAYVAEEVNPHLTKNIEIFVRFSIETMDPLSSEGMSFF